MTDLRRLKRKKDSVVFRAKKTTSFVGSKWWLSRSFLLLLLFNIENLEALFCCRRFLSLKIAFFSFMSKDALPYSCAFQAFHVWMVLSKEGNVIFSSNPYHILWWEMERQSYQRYFYLATIVKYSMTFCCQKSFFIKLKEKNIT